MEKQILSLLEALVAIASVTNTEKEQEVEAYLDSWLSQLPYFKAHPELQGTIELPQDSLHRRVVYGLVKGPGPKTVLLMNHHDVVGTEVYGAAEPYAYKPQQLVQALLKELLDEEARADAESGEWLFGRGTCDMKGGMAAQLIVLKEYADRVLALEQEPGGSKPPAEGTVGAEATVDTGEDVTKNGSLLFISVPDEESFSVGMRGALPFLQQLKEKYSLTYELLINCEPNRQQQGIQTVSVGSVGKLLPVVLVQGKVVQVGSYEEGLNPIGVLAAIVAATEGDKIFVESCGSERTVPPVWGYMRDLKPTYDFSLPKQAAGYCNILTFSKAPEMILNYFVIKCKAAVRRAPKPVQVLTYGQLLEAAKAVEGYEQFATELEAEEARLLNREHWDYPAVTIYSMQQLLGFLRREEPVVVIGFAPPYYPAVNSPKLAGAAFKRVEAAISAALPVHFEQYFLGVSDCSYCGLMYRDRRNIYGQNTSLWGKSYYFDNEALAKLNIPFVLLGPWGKDLHQATERVNINSLTRVLPRALRQVLQAMWQ